jgi:hypothetical protein
MAEYDKLYPSIILPLCYDYGKRVPRRKRATKCIKAKTIDIHESLDNFLDGSIHKDD